MDDFSLGNIKWKEILRGSSADVSESGTEGDQEVVTGILSVYLKTT